MKMRMVSLILVIVMAAITLSACTSTEAEQENPFSGRFETHALNNYWSVLEDKETGVCYIAFLEYRTGAAITTLVDRNGNPVTVD